MNSQLQIDRDNKLNCVYLFKCLCEFRVKNEMSTPNTPNCAHEVHN